MEKTNVSISRSNDGYSVVVDGRATFECSPPIRSLANNLASDAVRRVTIDLKTCSWMDSTFMGTLAILGLNAKKNEVILNVLNADEKNIKLLKELGIYKLFVFGPGDPPSSSEASKEAISPLGDKKQEVAKTVLEAHETLMSMDEKNVSKFKKVVELVKKDIKNKTDED